MPHLAPRRLTTGLPGGRRGRERGRGEEKLGWGQSRAGMGCPGPHLARAPRSPARAPQAWEHDRDGSTVGQAGRGSRGTAGLGASRAWARARGRMGLGDTSTRVAVPCSAGAPAATRRQRDGCCGRAVKCRDLSVPLAAPGEDLAVARPEQPLLHGAAGLQEPGAGDA